MARLNGVDRSSDGPEGYDGRLPKGLSIQSGTINFNEKDVEGAYSNGEIDDQHKLFLLSLLAISRVNPQVAKDVAAYLVMVQRGHRPTTALFELVQSLGLKHHPDNALNISGLALPGLDFEGAIFGSSLCINHAEIRGDVHLIRANIQVVHGNRVRINGALYLSDLKGEEVSFKGAQIDRVFCCNSDLNDMTIDFGGASINVLEFDRCKIGTLITKGAIIGNSILGNSRINSHKK